MINIRAYGSLLLFLAILWIQTGCTDGNAWRRGENKADAALLEQIDTYFMGAAAQYKGLMKELPDGRFPKTYYAGTDQLETCSSAWWVSGFYPGTLLHLYEETGDRNLFEEALRRMEMLKKEQHNKTTHDLGFMMYNSFGHADKIAPSPEYKQILLTSARNLASRFDPKVGAIRSWDSGAGDYLVIVDNMLNLELLFWATEATGDSSFYQIAIAHANKTMEHHFRPDNSSYQVVNYDPATGAVQQKRTAQGAADESAWARGQAWGLYGFTMMYRITQNSIYLEQATKIAEFMLRHPHLPEDKIPYWDFNAPNIPHALRDASAGAIMASALLELSEYITDSSLSSHYFHTAETLIKNLSASTYRAAAGTNGGFILKHGVGHMPQGTEIDVPLSYADYYYVEAMRRYKNVGKKQNIQ